MEAILVPMSSIPGVRPIRQTSLLWVWATALAGFGFLFGQCLRMAAACICQRII